MQFIETFFLHNNFHLNEIHGIESTIHLDKKKNRQITKDETEDCTYMDLGRTMNI